MGKIITATPDTWQNAINEAVAGGVDVVKFEGEFPRVTIYNIEPENMVELDLSEAHIVSYATQNTGNWRHYKGLFKGATYTQAQIQGSHDLEFDSCAFDTSEIGNCGLGCSRNSEKLYVHDCLFTGAGGDGSDFSSCRKVRVEHCRYANYVSTDALHSDALQMWQEAGYWTIEDIAIRYNTVVAQAQGFGIYSDNSSIAGISLVANTVSTIMAHAGCFLNILEPPARNSRDAEEWGCDNECRNNTGYTMVGCPLGWAGAHWRFESMVGAPLLIEGNIEGPNGLG
jgi:hypothetical protein